MGRRNGVVSVRVRAVAVAESGLEWAKEVGGGKQK